MENHLHHHVEVLQPGAFKGWSIGGLLMVAAILSWESKGTPPMPPPPKK